MTRSPEPRLWEQDLNLQARLEFGLERYPSVPFPINKVKLLNWRSGLIATSLLNSCLFLSEIISGRWNCPSWHLRHSGPVRYWTWPQSAGGELGLAFWTVLSLVRARVVTCKTRPFVIHWIHDSVIGVAMFMASAKSELDSTFILSQLNGFS